MFSILLEVKSIERQSNDFYNPPIKEFIKYPRTENGITKAVQELNKVAQNHDWIEDYRFTIYEGKYRWYKDMKPILIIDKTGNILFNQLQ
jgi:hypothetical protein